MNFRTFSFACLGAEAEALANAIVGFIGLKLLGGSPKVPLTHFAFSGISQVSAKAFTTMSMANGVSFPVATLGKAGKMAPVMVGSLVLGHQHYSIREYLSVTAIIAGTCLVSLGKMKAAGQSSVLGLVCIVIALSCDGVTAGLQQLLKAETKEKGISLSQFDFMFYTNLFMLTTGMVQKILKICSYFLCMRAKHTTVSSCGVDALQLFQHKTRDYDDPF